MRSQVVRMRSSSNMRITLLCIVNLEEIFDNLQKIGKIKNLNLYPLVPITKT